MDYIALTEREQNVVNYLAQGLNNDEISKLLNISVHTTKAHLESIYEKFEVHNRVQAVIKAIRLGVIEINNLIEKDSVK